MLDTLKLAGLVPVSQVTRAEDAVPLCRALAEGGLPVAEITSARTLRRKPFAACTMNCLK